MGAKDKKLLEHLIKSWAQEHTSDFAVADHSPDGMKITSDYLTWVVKEGHAVLDLASLVDKIDNLARDS